MNFHDRNHDRDVDRDLERAKARARLRRGMYLLPSLFTAGNIGAGYFCDHTDDGGDRGETATRIRIWIGRRWRYFLRFPLTRWMGALRG